MSESSYLKTVIPDRVFFFSAIGDLKDDDNEYRSITVIGWVEYETIKPNLQCCLTYPNQNRTLAVSSFVVHAIYEYTIGKSIKGFAFNINCPINYEMGLPANVALIESVDTCEGTDNYLDIEYPVHHPGELAVCSKAAFGKLDPNRLVEYFEMQKLLGVDMVVILVMEGLNKEAIEVLKYNESTGHAHLYPYKTRHSKPGKSCMWSEK